MNHHNFVSDKYDNNEMDLERGDSNMMITEYNTNDYDDHGDDQTVIPNERFEEDYDDDGDDDGNKNSSRSSYSWQDLPPPRQETAWEDESSYDYFFRRIRPSDRRSIQELHETWFPVNYQTEFYDELVHGRMCHTGDELYTNLIVSKEDPSELRACIVAAVVPANRLNRSSRQLLLPSSYPTPPSTSYPHQSPMIPPHALPPRRRQRQPMHCRACYIMTLGTVHKYRQAGLATQLIEQCYKEIIENDPQCGALYLHVITTNPSAIRFYERLGFWRVQEIPDYYYIEEQYYNCYLYAKYFHGKKKEKTHPSTSLHSLGKANHLLTFLLHSSSILKAIEDIWIFLKYCHGGYRRYGTRSLNNH